ncbi:MAG: tetratricopeptide repeat protein [Candidatus Latescibacterota bacterium]
MLGKQRVGGVGARESWVLAGLLVAGAAVLLALPLLMGPGPGSAPGPRQLRAVRQEGYGHGVARLPASAASLEARLGLGLLLWQQGRTDRAEAVLRRAASLPGAGMAVHLALASLYEAMGRLQAAEAAGLAALAAAPQDPRPSLMLGRCYALQRRWHEAVVQYRSARALGADEAVVEEHLICVQLARGEYSEALPRLQRLAAAAPERSEPHFLLGLLHEQQGDQESARQAYEEALLRQPSLTPQANPLAWLESQLPDDLERATALAAALLEPQAPEAVSSLILSLQTARERSAARADAAPGGRGPGD